MPIPFPNIDPIIISFGPFAIRWYAVAYIIGIVVGGLYINWMNKKTDPHLPNFNALDNLLTYAIIGIIAGGRLGYVCFYQPAYFLENPSEIIKLWHGGMSFHGGLIGVITAIWIFAKKHQYKFWEVIDLAAIATPIGLGLGRIANFINGELFGRATDMPWAIAFPAGGFIGRHPSQLYEAALEGIVLFFILFTLARFAHAREKPALLSGIFLCGYSLARISVEPFREPDEFLGFIIGHITMGQVLSMPMFLIGCFLVFCSTRRA